MNKLLILSLLLCSCHYDRSQKPIKFDSFSIIENPKKDDFENPNKYGVMAKFEIFPSKDEKRKMTEEDIRDKQNKRWLEEGNVKER